MDDIVERRDRHRMTILDDEDIDLDLLDAIPDVEEVACAEPAPAEDPLRTESREQEVAQVVARLERMARDVARELDAARATLARVRADGSPAPRGWLAPPARRRHDRA